ncbi:MAG: hypothetical protein K6D96_01665 [Acetatifactor sp.]|nr:hypothetical protein [Acetatifactor sp.]
MFNNSDGGLFMPVAPAYGMAGSNGGGLFGGEGIWALIVLVLLFGGGFGGGMGGYGNMMLGYDFPWLMNGQQGINDNVSDGFRDQMLQTTISSTNDRIGNLSTQLCNCCADMAQTVNSGFANAETAANARQMANLQQIFGVQTQLAQASADNRLGVANLGSDIAREACATRTNDTQNTQSILNVINGGIQSIKDQLCQDKIDAKNDTIAQLRQELLYARGQDSQDVQTARILAGQTAEVDALYNRLSSCPVPTVPVYGSQRIFSCNNNGGCGCNGSFLN